MTDAQELWEAWFRAYVQVSAAWPEQVVVRCPQGDGGHVQIAYIGDPESLIGTAFAWCDKGRHGIYLSRAGIPPGAPMVTFDATDEEQAAVIPPDLELLDPDPSSPD